MNNDDNQNNYNNGRIITNGTFFNEPLNNTPTNEEFLDSNIPLTEPAPQTEIPTDYTNPQTINESFENQASIGMLPPTSFQNVEPPKNNPNKKLILIIVIAISIVVVGLLTYLILKFTKIFAQEIVIETKVIENNIGEALSTNITDYATISGTDLSNCSPVDVSEVNINKEGTYNYTITCGKAAKKGTIKIIDNIEIIVDTKTVYKAKGETLLPNEFIVQKDDSLRYNFVSQNDVDRALSSTSGTYNIMLKISKGVKTIEKVGKLVMIEYPIRGYITCKDKTENSSISGVTKQVAIKLPILNDNGKNSYGGFGYEITSFAFSDNTMYMTYEREYNTNKNITIDGVSGFTTFSKNESGNSVITIMKELDNNVILSRYGEDNMLNYATIGKYFGSSTLKYVCEYEKA